MSKPHYTKFSFLIFLIFLFVATKGHSVRVAFFKGFDQFNQPIELLPGGEFFHVAIQIDGFWYHTSTVDGVELLYNLLDLSQDGMQIHSMLESKEYDLRYEDIKPYIGLPFDFYYDWDCKDRTDCTKFIAQLLDVPPTTSFFQGPHWSISYGISEGGVGVSPDELFTRLKQKGFYHVSPRNHLRSKPINECRKLLDNF